MLVKFNLKLLPTISYLKGYSYPKLYCKKLSNQKPTGTIGNRVQLQNDIENCSMSCVFLRSPSSKRPYIICTAFCDDLLQQVHWISSPVNRRDEIAFNRHSSRLHIRDLTIRQQPRPWKRRWKIDFTSFHFFGDYSKGPSSCLKEGSFGWSSREGPAPEFRRKYTGTTKKCTKKRDARAELLGAIHSTKIPTGPTGKSGPPHKVDPFFRNFSGRTEPIHRVLDQNFRKFWLNGSRPLFCSLNLLFFWRFVAVAVVVS